jgi:flagellar biosynthesis protein FlhF
MRVKRYVVDSMPDALQQIRSDLGKDAVILNTKEIRMGGFLGLFTKKKIEVIAATDTSSAANNAQRTKQAPVLRPSMVGLQSQSAGTPGLSSSTGSVAVMDQPVPEPRTVKSSQPDQLSASAFVEQLIAARQAEQELTPPQPVIPAKQGAALYSGSNAAAVAAAVKPAAPLVESDMHKPELKEDSLLAEIRAMKQMMQKLSTAGASLAVPVNPFVEDLKNRLLDQEVSPELADKLINELVEEADAAGENIDRDYAYRSMRNQLSTILGSSTDKALRSDTHIAHFVGPTGVGKTTTIAKLAAEQVLKYRRKVGFITSDTYRIAAVDQLKTYATILGVPLEVVFSPQDLRKAFEALKDRDIIFMDTAGRNFRNEMYVSELNALLQSGGQSETFLVLSLTMKYKDMRAIAENFSKFKLDKVLFTKRDETDTFGPIINLTHEFPLQLSYITTGQNVPDDFTVADENELIDLILEEQADE